MINVNQDAVLVHIRKVLVLLVSLMFYPCLGFLPVEFTFGN